jgi:hypothetical protein
MKYHDFYPLYFNDANHVAMKLVGAKFPLSTLRHIISTGCELAQYNTPWAYGLIERRLAKMYSFLEFPFVDPDDPAVIAFLEMTHECLAECEAMIARAYDSH